MFSTGPDFDTTAYAGLQHFYLKSRREYLLPCLRLKGAFQPNVVNVTAIFAPILTLEKRHREAEEPQGDGGLVGIHADEVLLQRRAR